MNMTGKQSTFDAKGPLAQHQLDTFYTTLWVTTFLLFAVGGTYLLAIWKFRIKKGDDPNGIPDQTHGHPLIEVGLVGISAGLLVIIAIPTFAGIMMMKRIPQEYVDKGIVEINVAGYQWWFNFEYPEEGFYSSNELVIPAGRPVRLNLDTKDVNHSFWIPKLSGKTDLIAGQTNQMWVMADEPGYFWGQCAEFCGDSHAYMLFRVIALPEDEYANWVEQQMTPTVLAESTTPTHIPAGIDAGLVGEGSALFKDNCLRCHSLNSTRQGMGAPNLAHFASRTSIAAGWYENDWDDGEGNAMLFHWIQHPDSVKPGNNMWRGFMNTDGITVQMEGLHGTALGDDQVHALVAYLHTLRHPDAIQYTFNTF